MPKTSMEYQYYRKLCGTYEAFTYTYLGSELVWDSSEEGFKVMITHFKKARAIYNLVGMPEMAKEMDTAVSVLTANKQSKATKEGISSTDVIHHLKSVYKQSINNHGIDSEATIRLGLAYARVLWDENCRIEAERLVTKLATISRRVHGPDHKVTVEADELVNNYMERQVFVLPDNKQFQALQYENDGEICVVQGPITEPRNTEDENIYHIANNLVIPMEGFAVVCHGLVSAPHLNGELGEVRGDVKHDDTEIRLAVHFETKVTN